MQKSMTCEIVQEEGASKKACPSEDKVGSTVVVKNPHQQKRASAGFILVHKRIGKYIFIKMLHSRSLHMRRILA
jgi:hypothetical protein